MRLSNLFTKTLREAPRDETSVSTQLLIRGGFMQKLSAGVYSFLPLGLMVLKKIENIIREEMNNIGGQEILMPALTPKENWQRTGRWDNFDALFKLEGVDEKEYALAATHEEIVVPLAQKYISSYRDLPLGIYQIQMKFRNELRAKAGLLRGREFLMKDLYSFHTSEKDLDDYYDKVTAAYFKILERCGLKEKTFYTLASGGSFSKYSHEFQTVSENGEDAINVCQKCRLAINQEIKNELSACPDCGGNKFKKEKAIEVANIFKLGTKYSDPFGLKFRDADGKEKTVVMGCYGMGPSRLMGAVAEIHRDSRGFIWPEKLAPQRVFLVEIFSAQKDEQIHKTAEEIYQDLQRRGAEVLYDDREDKTTGEKFADADLLGIAWRVVVSEKTVKQGKVELKKRDEKKVELVSREELLQAFN